MKAAVDRSSTPKTHYGDIEVELAQMAFRNILVTIILAMVAVAGTTGLLAHLYHDPSLWYFNIAMTSISLTRVGIIVAFNWRRHTPLHPRNARRWIAVHSTMTLVSFTVTGAFMVYTFSHHDATGRVLSAVGAFILCAGLSGRLSARPKVDQLAGIIMMAGLAWGVAHSGERYAWVVCVMIGMFLYGHCVAVQNRFDITVEQLRSRRKLRALADHDALTGLANRRQFEASLSKMCSQTAPFALLFLDLDGFKQVNDTLGHATGDILLEHVAQRLRGIVRDSDLLARLGGDEFGILHAPGATEATAASLAKRIIQTISAPYEIEGHAVNVGTSIGIQLSASEAANEASALLEQADKALYLVKQSGKGNFRFAAPDESSELHLEENTPSRLGRR